MLQTLKKRRFLRARLKRKEKHLNRVYLEYYPCTVKEYDYLHNRYYYVFELRDSNIIAGRTVQNNKKILSSEEQKK